MLSLMFRILPALSCALGPVLAGGEVRAQGRWDTIDRNAAAVAASDRLLYYYCDERSRGVFLMTDQRLPTFGAPPFDRHETTYQLDGGTPGRANLFVFREDLEEPSFTYHVVLETRGMDTTMEDVLRALGSADELELVLWREEVAFPLDGARQAIAEVDRNCP